MPSVSLITKYSTEWRERVKKHIEEWSSTALDTIFGLVTTDSLKYVCLFINKKDLLLNVNNDEIKQEYYKLIKKIRVRTESVGIELKVLYGSAREGDQVFTLRDHLRKSSILGYNPDKVNKYKI
ncbi:hypothetical protein [Nostoc sp. CHAB 5715]|uniref:hypothetical protein n=1 Tax=Nostoc sp. CHAB 5715 TaxID=2780400 RepID=UPI001E56DDCE|nr:hypothetical protein [Nostoc sp. CHAB 5715]MCC5621996.1 hypothetical protein [Nostoc sp. CHAB 5715]